MCPTSSPLATACEVEYCVWSSCFLFFTLVTNNAWNTLNGLSRSSQVMVSRSSKIDCSWLGMTRDVCNGTHESTERESHCIQTFIKHSMAIPNSDPRGRNLEWAINDSDTSNAAILE